MVQLCSFGAVAQSIVIGIVGVGNSGIAIVPVHRPLSHEHPTGTPYSPQVSCVTIIAQDIWRRSLFG